MNRLFAGVLFSLCAISVSVSQAATPDETDLLERSSPARADKIGDINAKTFDSWDGPLGVGDCRARNAKLTLYENGSLELEVELLSRDIDAEWIQSFDFYDGLEPSGTSLGKRDGLRFAITVARKWYSWRWGGPSSPDPQLAEMFERIQMVEWNVEY